jgi:hypothetical protein
MTQNELNEKLFDAAYNNNIYQVEKTLSLGADVNTSDENGITVLMWACWHGNTDIARLLIEHGADVNRQDKLEWIYRYSKTAY